jgi:hypothetical protein
VGVLRIHIFCIAETRTIVASPCGQVQMLKSKVMQLPANCFIGGVGGSGKLL